jgi:glutaredoxin-like protein
MQAWQQQQQADNISFIADGNGEFTQAMGMLVDKRELGFGARSWRYSMLVDDMVVRKMFVEPDKEGDPFEVSDADTMLEYINPQAVKPSAVAIISRPGCQYCIKAKQLLVDNDIEYQDIVLGKDVNSIALKAISGSATVPQLFFNGKNIGGFSELSEYLR